MSIAEKLVTIAENVDKVYEAGKRAGGGGDNTYFWEVFQNQGNRTSYQYAFYQWDGTLFNPKYDIIPTGQYGADSMFYGATNIGDLDALLNSKGIVLDFSNTSRLNSTFQRCSASKLPVINLKNCKNMILSFQSMSNLTELTLENLSADCTFDRVFMGNTKLATLSIRKTIDQNGFDVAIGQNGFDVASCPLSHDSLINILDCLSANGAGKTVTLGSTNLAKLTDTEKAIATNKGWVLA